MGNCYDKEKAVCTNPLAVLSENSKGRLKPLDADGYRTDFQRDIHRIIYSQPFRRLRHKTQVFFLPNNDHICTRMEHVLHVASASRTVARHLGLNEDLAEAIGIGHDLGHAPFGHHGETVLDSLAKKHGVAEVFQHEIHGLRVVDKLAELDREPGAGLNLTYEVRDGIISHCGEKFEQELMPSTEEKDLDSISNRGNVGMPVTLEGCIVRMVDKIAYGGRDIEDALVAGLISEGSIPEEVVRLLGSNNGEIVGNLLEDLIDYSREHDGVIGLSKDKHNALLILKEFNYKHIYKCDKVEKYKKQATRAIEQLFEKLLEDLDKTDRLTKSIDSLHEEQVYAVLGGFIKKVGYTDKEPNALIVLDFISGMTDNYVVDCLDQLFVPKNIA